METPDLTELLRCITYKKNDLCRKLLHEMPKLVKMKDAGGYTALHIAAQFNPEICALLIDKKAKVDAVSKRKETPLMIACTYGNAEQVNMLLEAGADTSLTNWNGETALHCVAASWLKSGDGCEIAEMLLAAGADTTIRDREGYTPYDLAVVMGNGNMAELLER